MKKLKLSLFIFFILFITGVNAQSVYTTKTGEKYHKENCNYLKYSKKEITLEKALELNYSPCSVCKPPTGNSGIQNAAKLDSSADSNRSTSESTTQSAQCSGKTQSGARCKRMTKNSSGRCYQH